MKPLALVLTLALVACDDGGPVASPTAPTPLDDPASRFVDQFWRDLIYDEHEQGTLLSASIIVDRQRHYAIDPTGMPADLVRRIHEIIPALWQQVTGTPFAGDIRVGAHGRKEGQVLWTLVRVGSLTGDTCGTSEGGYNRGPGWITLDLSNVGCAGAFLEVFVHEFGHDVGLHHTRDQTTVMSEGVLRGLTAFTAREQYHAQLAYEIGPGAPYCGWPKGPGC